MWRRKFIVILLGIILVISIPPYSTQGKNSPQNVPKWSVGDKWTYQGEGNYSFEDTEGIINAGVSITDLALEVVEISAEDYILSLSGGISVDAYVKIESIDLETTIKFSMGKIGGMFIVSQSNLGIKEAVLNLSGLIVISLAPLPLPFKMGMSGEFSPEWKILDFPLVENKEWDTSDSTLLFNVSEDLFKFIENLLNALSNFLPQEYMEIIQEIIDMIREMFPMEIDMPVAHMKCEGEKEVNVKAGTYNAFLINVEDIFPLYFAEALANFIKVNYCENDYAGEIEADVELASTTYSPPGAPDTPSKPSGKRRVMKGREYEYSTSCVDPNGGMLSYGWDWDGDMVVDEWTSFYPSGQEVRVNHSWQERGKYEVRVKAKNEYGLESKWSEPLVVKTWFSFAAPYTFINIFSRYLYSLILLYFSRER